MSRPLIDLPSAPITLGLDDPALALAPYAGSLLVRALRYVGDAPPYRPAVAIVGTRKADPEALDFTRGLASSLASAGVVIVSGGARGIDAAAHEGALESGRTVAVLPSGLARAYPPQHAALFARIARRGALISAYDDDDPPVAFRLLERNALVAALASAVIVVQAPERSGALSTAAAAQALGRAVFAVPSAPWDPKGRGNAALLAGAARPCATAGDVAALLGVVLTPRASSVSARPRSSGAGAARTLSALLGARPRHVDELVLASGLDVVRVRETLVEMVLDGEAEERPGDRYVRARDVPG